VPSSSKLKAVKLLSIAGAYWKAMSTTARAAHLWHGVLHAAGADEYLHQIEEQEARPSQAGPELDLFSIQELPDRG